LPKRRFFAGTLLNTDLQKTRQRELASTFLVDRPEHGTAFAAFGSTHSTIASAGIHVEADNIANLVNDQRIARKFERLLPMWLQAERAPD
jgi:hypothetical protein